jgi:hypothetical protein
VPLLEVIPREIHFLCFSSGTTSISDKYGCDMLGVCLSNRRGSDGVKTVYEGGPL